MLDDVEGVGVCRELTQTPTVTDRKVETDTKKTNTDRNTEKSIQIPVDRH